MSIFKKKGIKPVHSGINYFLKKCPSCESEDSLELDSFHEEISCRSCGYVVADAVENCGCFLMLIEKQV